MRYFRKKSAFCAPYCRCSVYSGMPGIEILCKGNINSRNIHRIYVFFETSLLHPRGNQFFLRTSGFGGCESDSLHEIPN